MTCSVQYQEVEKVEKKVDLTSEIDYLLQLSCYLEFWFRPPGNVHSEYEIGVRWYKGCPLHKDFIQIQP